MPRCESCNKFVALEMQEPELGTFNEYVELDTNDGSLRGTVSADVRIVRNSECCGEEMKEANLDLEHDVTVSAEAMASHVEKKDDKFVWRPGCALDVSSDDPEQIEEGGGRYKKSYYGASMGFTISCSCGAELYEGTMEDKVAASGMDELT